MIGFLHSLFALISQFMRIFEEYRSNKQRHSDNDQRDKAYAYEKLQKAIRARAGATKSDAIDDVMSDDGYKRK